MHDEPRSAGTAHIVVSPSMPTEGRADDVQQAQQREEEERQEAPQEQDQPYQRHDHRVGRRKELVAVQVVDAQQRFANPARDDPRPRAVSAIALKPRANNTALIPTRNRDDEHRRGAQLDTAQRSPNHPDHRSLRAMLSRRSSGVLSTCRGRDVRRSSSMGCPRSRRPRAFNECSCGGILGGEDLASHLVAEMRHRGRRHLALLTSSGQVIPTTNGPRRNRAGAKPARPRKGTARAALVEHSERERP